MQPPFELLENERVIWSGRMSYKANLFLFLLGLLMIPIIIVCLMIAFLRVRNSRYIITNRRVYAEYGIIRRRVFDINIKDIKGYLVHQGPFGTLYNYGDIVISTPEQLAGITVFKGVSNPMRIIMVLEELTKGEI